MNRKANYILWGLSFWFIVFLAWHWWKSYPLVRWGTLSYPQGKEEKLDSLLHLSLVNFKIPGVLIGVVENEKLVYLKAVGLSDLETKDTLTTSTPFPLASVSKLATALTASAYFNKVNIPLTTSVNSLLPENKKLAAEFNSISIQNLLNHTSGLKDSKRLDRVFLTSQDRNLKNLAKKIKKPEKKSESPQVAEINYDLLGYLLETHSGMEFEKLVKELVLIPSGMNSSFFNKSLNPGDNTNLKGYQSAVIWKRLKEKPTQFERIPSPSSGLISTGLDLGNAMIHFSRWEMGFVFQHLENLREENKTPSGFSELELLDHRFLGNLGEQGAYNSLFFFSKELDKGIFILTNGLDVEGHRVKLAEAVLSVLLSNP